MKTILALTALLTVGCAPTPPPNDEPPPNVDVNGVANVRSEVQALPTEAPDLGSAPDMTTGPDLDTPQPSCGNYGEACCSGQCDTSYNNSGLVCDNGTCLDTCGHSGEKCCPGVDKCKVGTCKSDTVLGFTCQS